MLLPSFFILLLKYSISMAYSTKMISTDDDFPGPKTTLSLSLTHTHTPILIIIIFLLSSSSSSSSVFQILTTIPHPSCKPYSTVDLCASYAIDKFVTCTFLISFSIHSLVLISLLSFPPWCKATSNSDVKHPMKTPNHLLGFSSGNHQISERLDNLSLFLLK